MRTPASRSTPALAAAALLLVACRTETKTVQVTAPASTYLVEYVPGAAPAAEGKSSFQLRIRKRADFAAATGLAVGVEPTMEMGSNRHGTPVASVVESSTPGTYDVTLYYLMGDAMNGTPTGYWELAVTIGTESTVFCPRVAAASMAGDTPKQRLYGPADVGASASMPNAYYLFLDAPVSLGASPRLQLYLTRAGNMATTFAPVTAATLTASADAAFTAPVTATHDGNGRWSIPLTGFPLAAGTAAPIYVKLAVGGEDKTTNGLAASGANAYATFRVTPRESYLVEYLPGAAAPAEGKSRFQLRVRRRSDFAAATGLAPVVKPVMDMGTMVHGTPVESVVESATPGTYDVTLYWLMGDSMGGVPMGYWELQVTVGSETSRFYPSVASAPMMGDTAKQRLYGPADVMGGMADYTYLFADGPVTGTPQVLRLYLTRAGSMITTFAPVTTATLTASTDTAFTSPLAATHAGDGHWTVSLPALPAGQSTLYVKLAVGGEDKTTNGQAASGANAYATFRVTPQ